VGCHKLRCRLKGHASPRLTIRTRSKKVLAFARNPATVRRASHLPLPRPHREFATVRERRRRPPATGPAGSSSPSPHLRFLIRLPSGPTPPDGRWLPPGATPPPPPPNRKRGCRVQRPLARPAGLLPHAPPRYVCAPANPVGVDPCSLCRFCDA